jgi:two-component system chemotaxis response regulator CheB
VSPPERDEGAAPYRVVGIGASAGGVDALIKVMEGLDSSLDAAVCVVLHVAATGKSLLPSILDRYTELPVAMAVDGERLVAGRVYVAPPDRHLLVADGRVSLTRGPKENGVRPAVDAMLRSLAASVGPGAIAVVLSGALGDGSNGALAVARAGGSVIVQDPEDAVVPSMPERALEAVGDVDSVLPATEIGREIARIANGGAGIEEHGMLASLQDPIEESRHRPDGPATGFTCPECSGALWELEEGGLVRYRCRIGHAYSEDAMLLEQGSSVEAALWAALEVLEERAEFLRRMAGRRAREHPRMRARLEAGAADALERAEQIRRALGGGGERPDAFRVEAEAGAAS